MTPSGDRYRGPCKSLSWLTRIWFVNLKELMMGGAWGSFPRRCPSVCARLVKPQGVAASVVLFLVIKMTPRNSLSFLFLAGTWEGRLWIVWGRPSVFM